MKGIWLAVGSLLSRGIIQTQEAIQFLVVVYVCDLLCDKKVKKKNPKTPHKAINPGLDMLSAAFWGMRKGRGGTRGQADVAAAFPQLEQATALEVALAFADTGLLLAQLAH